MCRVPYCPEKFNNAMDNVCDEDGGHKYLDNVICGYDGGACFDSKGYCMIT